MEHAEQESRIAGDNQNKQDDEESSSRHEELKKMIDAKLALRHLNLKPDRPDTSFLRTLDSSIKKNTAVIRKLKQITEEQKESLMEELKGVNLSKFVSEAVSYICEAKLKSSDIQAAVQICSLLHQRYTDFSPCLIQGLVKVFSSGKTGEELDSNSKAMKKRSTLKLLIELYFVGIVEDASVFVTIIKELTSSEHLKDKEATQTNISLLTSFAKQGKYFLGLPLPNQEIHEEFFKGLNVTADQKKYFKKALGSYYEAVVELLHSEHHSLRVMEMENSKIFHAKGELSEDSTASYEKLRKSYDQSLRSVSSLAEAIEMEPPVMPDDGSTRVVTGGDGSSSAPGKDAPAMEPIWDDEDTRAFYESLPDLRAFVPAVLLGESEPKSSDPPELLVEGDGETSTNAEETEGKSDEKGKKKDEKEKQPKEKEKVKSTDNKTFEALLHKLPSCISRDLIDQVTVEFCYLNTKNHRKKLVRALFNVSRTSLELLPYYSRMVATLSTCMKDVPSTLLAMLEEEFNFLINKKDQINIETKIKNIRFIGELCKFKIAPPGLIFSCLKQCLDDFTHHNIDVLCTLLETCGRFLYRSPETSTRMANMLDIMMRLKSFKNLDPRHSTLVENAYYLCKPPEKTARTSKIRPPLHQYIRKLLFTDLEKSSVEYVLRQLRKLPWAECEPYIIKCFLKVHKGKFGHIQLIALLTAGLSRYHDDFGVSIIDEVLEEIRVGLELNDFNMQQKRLAYMRFLGDLYSYRLVDSSVIFETLFLILSFGHGTSEQDVLDPPEDCFRIRLIISLLQTCGHYFDVGSSKRKLNRFFLYFQRYILSKGQLPFDIEFEIQDMFAELRPKMTRYTSIDDITTALVELEETERITNINPTNASEVSERTVIPATEDPAGDSDSYSGRSVREDEEESDVGSEGDDEAGPAVSDEDDEVAVRKKRADIDPAEMEDFDRELKALMQESLESRKQELRVRPATLNMMIPMNIFEGGFNKEVESSEDTMDEERENSKVRVKVLVKKGNKQQTKQMYIPGDSSLVQGVKEKELAEMQEKQNIKRMILEYNEREEDEANGVLPSGNWPALGAGSGTGGSSVGSGTGGSSSGAGRGNYGRPRSYHVAGGAGYYRGYGRRR